MDFINKLIKKGIFGLLFVFGFFVFTTQFNVQATGCEITLNSDAGYDGKYLVLSEQSNWNDPGVTARCGSIETNISVRVNNGAEIKTTDSAEGEINSYLRKPGFYTIEYSITGKEKVYGETYVTRQIRVLPNDLNSVRNLWLGETQSVNTTSNDEFVKIIDIEEGYLAVGNFGTVGYVVKFNSRGEYVWTWKSSDETAFASSEVSLSDLAYFGSDSSVYYVSGSVTTGADASKVTKGFIKPIIVTASTGVTANAGTLVTLDEFTNVNKMVVSNNYIFATGYKTNSDGTNSAKLLRKELNSASGELLTTTLIYPDTVATNVDSKYNSLIVNSLGKIVVVGETTVSGYKGAVAGTIMICDTDFSCETSRNYLYNDEALGNTMITRFEDVIEYNGEYVVVGNSNAKKVKGNEVSNNSGSSDALVLLISSSLEIKDAELRGSSSEDSFNSIKKIDSNNYITVGNVSSSGYYAVINIKDNALNIEDKTVTGNSSLIINDVHVTVSSNGEKQYVFVGANNSTTVESIITNTKGNNDALFAILDVTMFSDFSDINVLKGSSICSDKVSTECSGSDVDKEYWLSYGDKKYNFIATISTEETGSVNTIHEFKNNQGIMFKIGRVINVVATPVPGDVEVGNTGIDKWYLYSRNQTIGENINNYNRDELWANLWSEYYYPVADGLAKTAGQYYTLGNGVFELDNTDGTTKDNYKLLPQETLNNNVAFQSIEKAKEYSALQEFARIALVKEAYNITKDVDYFPGELNDLTNGTGKNYYFIYYIDADLGEGSCRTENFVLTGKCTAYTGYAFASLKRVKEISLLLLEMKQYFVSESNNRYSSSSNLSAPTQNEFIEEIVTEPYMQNYQINVPQGLYLDVKYYAIDTSSVHKYIFSSSPTSLEVTTGGQIATFNAAGTYQNEGKYVVKLCYNAETCGKEATFVIDRTRPVINYELKLDKKTGSIDKSWSIDRPYGMTSNGDILSVADIDPYAYTIVDGVKYYLQCNATINSSSCISNITEFIKMSFEYDKENPDKVYHMAVYDRAGNYSDVYFAVATGKPTVQVSYGDTNDIFTLTLDFYGKNKIDSFSVKYSKSEECEDGQCADADLIKSRLEQLYNVLTNMNKWIEEQMVDNPEFESPIGEIRNSIDIAFVLSEFNEDGTYKGGIQFPKIEMNEELGFNVILEGEVDTLPVSKGLYEFSITDRFGLNSTAYGGIGIKKAELGVYVNDDQWFEDKLENITVALNRKLPKTIEEHNVELENDEVFKVVVPSTYEEYLEYITVDSYKDAVDKTMFFTQKYIYIKFKASNYGITKINIASGIGEYGNPNGNYKCLYEIYGSQVSDLLGSDCATKIPENNLASLSDSTYGIYSFGSLSTDDETYYYLAFTKDGTYSIESKVNVAQIGGTSGSMIAEPVSKVFSIDTVSPYVETEVIGLNNTCKGDSNSYTVNDFISGKPNIGNCDMRFNLDSEVFTYINNSNIEDTSINKLLLIKINGVLHNAHMYALNEDNDPANGLFINFVKSGDYEIVFMDAALNETVYRFSIDKEAPKIGEIVDNNGKNTEDYLQYVDAKVTVSENTLLTDKSGSILTIGYWLNDDKANTRPVVVQYIDGNCVVTQGEGTVSCENNEITLEFVIALNKTERLSNNLKLSVSATDYFGNSFSTFKNFSFDNYSPYIYFNSENYTPTTKFGKNEFDENKDKMLEVDAQPLSSTFDCKDTASLISGKIICKDTPENPNKDNKVVVEAYEAYKVTHNNFIKTDTGYSLDHDGKYVNPRTSIYTATYQQFATAADLISMKGVIDIYSKQEFTLMTSVDRINPNVTYYYGDTKTPVSIENMYSENLCADATSKECELYNAYINEGYFKSLNGYYEQDNNKYVVVASNDIIDSNFASYYYVSRVEEDEDYSDNYLPALTLANTKVKYNETYYDIKADRIKLFDEDVTYYNIINKTSSEDTKNYTSIAVDVYAVVDTRIWQISEKFTFTLASVTGRPIIFVATDGAGNVSANYLETVIIVNDTEAPLLESVYTSIYKKDTSTVPTDDNYVYTTKYYKLANPKNIQCEASTFEYYEFVNSSSSYKKVDCGSWEDGVEYYVASKTYVKSSEAESPDGIYYVLDKTLIEDGNYLTKDNFIVTFNEPIYRVECTYYEYYLNSDGEQIGETKPCSFNGAEFDYKEEKMTFNLISEITNKNVHFTLVVYDFSENRTEINSLFIDREKPRVDFNEPDKQSERIEVDYSDKLDDEKTTIYDNSYIMNSSKYNQDIHIADSANNQINSNRNPLSVTIEYYKFKYGVTYKNYVKEGNVFKQKADGLPKSSSETYYILVKKPTDYILMDMDSCIVDSDSNEYCYIKDNQNYYPNLVNKNTYWEKVENNVILNNLIGVYKVVYVVTDYSGNVSEELIKTVYIDDTVKPKLLLNDAAADKDYGYHNKLKVDFLNEHESFIYEYICISSDNCILPTNIFQSSTGNVTLNSYAYPEVTQKTYNEDRVYKLYFQDKGTYVNSLASYTVCDENGENCEVKYEEVRTLKYQYTEYQFIIDTKAPTMYVNAYKDNNGKLYYIAKLSEEESLYCLKGSDGDFQNCTNYTNGTSSKLDDDQQNTSLTTYTAMNEEGLVVEKIIYRRLENNELTYFYNTYYYRTNTGFVAYEQGESFKTGNIYIVTSIELYFREDGEYSIKVQDKAGNSAGRKTSSKTEQVSRFTVDNTAPTYNKSSYAPSGINYWFSVPKQVIKNSDIVNGYLNFTKDSSGVYNIFDTANAKLNSDFFYAFATKDEADKYLIKIYQADLKDSSQTCENGTGISYSSYYDTENNTVYSECFVPKNGKTKEEVAWESISESIKSLVFTTFSGGTLFGDSSINQDAYNPTSSDDDLQNKDMYSYIYLKTENNNISIAETCAESDSVTCEKINMKVIKYSSSSNVLSLEIGGNAHDTSEITYYKYQSKLDVDTKTSSFEITLAQNTYYVFAERDTVISYANYDGISSSDVTHSNVSYYALFVDNTNPIKVYYEDDNGISTNVINVSDFVRTNDDNYYLILRNYNVTNFAKEYEINEIKESNEFYSYLRLKVDGVYVNINNPEYLKSDANGYYFRIPVAITENGKITHFEFYDKAGNVTSFDISRSKKAPTIDLIYEGEGKDQTVTVTIKDTEITALKTSELQILFSRDGQSYSSALTGNIRLSLLCSKGDQVDPYGCIGSSNEDGKVVRSVKISNQEDLYGFFKIMLKDDHGNENEVEFIYNPADLTATYTTANIKYVTPGLDPYNVRMVSNEALSIKWNNEWNYLVLYKIENGELVEVCNTVNMNKENGICSSNPNNKVQAFTNETTNLYDYSVLYYEDEGIYQAQIFNRQSITINNRCYENGELKEDCKEIKSSTNLICSWDINKDICDDALQVLTQEVTHTNVSNTYNKFEIDTTAPLYNIDDFEVQIPSGNVDFVNNGEYTNAKVTINWPESLVVLHYRCEYVGESAGNECIGKSTQFDLVTKLFVFEIDNKMSTKYTIWFEDYAGNNTQNHSLTFTINVKLPEILVFQTNEKGIIDPDKQVVNNSKIGTNARLKCYSDGTEVDCKETYDVVLQKYGANGYETIVVPNNTYVTEDLEAKYRYVVSIKSVSGYVYQNLNTEFIFTIDKVAPVITPTVVEGIKHETGIYKGSVRLILDDEKAIGTIYGNCVVITNDPLSKDVEYQCDETPLVESFKDNYTLTKTGIYKVTAVDEIGNVTTGQGIRYITIDNEKPTITVKAQTDYSTYELPENGYTNVSSVIVEARDNNPQSYFMYRVKTGDGEYGDWNVQQSSTLELIEEGMYEIKPVDIVGNEGITRHFIIYRQTPKYYVYVDDKLNTVNDIITKDAFITWDEPTSETQAPIVKVTMNGRPYERKKKITDTGEYLFVFMDLAGNVTTHKLTINKSESICLDNVNIIPNKQYLFNVNDVKFSGGEGYTFDGDDVLILATPTNYYNGNSMCGENALSYRSIDKNAYIVISESTAKYINNNKNVPVTLNKEYIDKINELGGYVYVIVVDMDVAKDELGFEIGENFFTKDPIGWTLIFVTGIGIIYVGLKLFVFKKKVKVLK